MKEQQKRKIQQFHPEIEDGTDLRRWPLESNTILIEYVCAQMTHYYPLLSFKLDKGRDHDED